MISSNESPQSIAADAAAAAKTIILQKRYRIPGRNKQPHVKIIMRDTVFLKSWGSNQM